MGRIALLVGGDIGRIGLAFRLHGEDVEHNGIVVAHHPTIGERDVLGNRRTCGHLHRLSLGIQARVGDFQGDRSSRNAGDAIVAVIVGQSRDVTPDNSDSGVGNETAGNHIENTTFNGSSAGLGKGRNNQTEKNNETRQITAEDGCRT